MGIFGRKRIKKIKKKDKGKLMPPVDIEKVQPPAQTPQMPKILTTPSFPPISKPSPPPSLPAEPKKKDEKPPTFAPLFIKLTRYKQILNSMNYLKMSLNLIRNQLAILNELERLRSENMKLLQSTAERVNKRLIKLDSEFMRPSGFMEEMPEMRMHEIETLESMITDLKAQLEGLKEEVETLA